jgi:hypothetical protein
LEIERLHQLEKSYVLLLNAFDGWELEWCGGGFDHFDAKGKTPKGKECVIEFKFRNKYYQTKMLEVFKYEKLMAMPDEVVKIYNVHDAKGSYMYWLNNLIVPEPVDMYCPKTTVWQNNKVNKSVYLLEESQAATISYI